MLIHPLAERLRGLGLAAMADAFLDMQTTAAAADLSREGWLGLLLDREATSRENKRLGRRLTQARLRQSAVIEDTDFRTARGLGRALFLQLASCDWIRQSQHLIICCQTGTGKSGLACALGHKACREGSRYSTGGRRGSSPNSPPPAARAGWRVCSRRWSAPGC
jgi:DNA replication protein DnaC